MSITRKSSDRLAQRLASITPEIKARVAPALVKSAEEVAGKARQLAEASRRTGDLIERIEVVTPGGTLEAGDQVVTLHELQATVHAGAPHSHLVELGTEPRQHKDGTSTGTMPAKPFMLPVPNIDPEVAKRNADQIAKNTQERERSAEAARKQGEAIQRTTQDAKFEQSIIGKSVGDQARLRTAYDLTNRLREQGIDLNQRMAGSELTYAQAIDQAAAAAGRKAEAEDRARKASAAAEAQAEAARQGISDGANAITDVFMAATQGADALRSALLDLATGILKNQLIKMFAAVPGMATLARCWRHRGSQRAATPATADASNPPGSCIAASGFSRRPQPSGSARTTSPDCTSAPCAAMPGAGWWVTPRGQ